MADQEIGWAILELMGHRRLAGYVSEQEIAGAAFIRVDVPGTGPCQRCSGQGGLQEVDLDRRPVYTEDPCGACGGLGAAVHATQYYSAAAVYCITPTTEAMARAVAIRNIPAPVQRWELPAEPSETEVLDAEGPSAAGDAWGGPF